MKFSNEQIVAIEHPSQRLLIVAGAGAGKTSTFINRIHHYCDNDIDPDSILALTFTNAAAHEMAMRYDKLCEHPQGRRPHFNTFHSFCYMLMRNYGQIRKACGYDSVPSVADESAVSRISDTAYIMCGAKTPKSKLQLGKGLNANQLFEQSAYRAMMLKLLKNENLITFDLLIDNIVDLFTSHSSCTAEPIKRFRHIFIDEFQDTDMRQWDMICAMEPETITAIGDANQAIYGFRGCTDKLIKQLADSDTWDVVKLSTNYRSSNQICKFANHIISSSSSNVSMSGTFDSDEVHIAPCKFDKLLLNELISASGTTAVLARTNREVEMICSQLKDCNIPFTCNNSYNHNYEIIEGLQSCSFTDWALSHFDKSSYYDILKSIISTYDVTDDEIVQHILSNSNCPKIVQDVWALKLRISALTNINDVAAVILNSIHIDTPNIIFENYDSILDWLRQIIRPADESIYVGTIHSSKGLEYDNVILYGVNSKSFKLKDSESYNLYYVGCTRARKHLTILKGGSSI